MKLLFPGQSQLYTSTVATLELTGGQAFEVKGTKAWLTCRVRGCRLASSNRNATWPVWMFELPVAAAGGDKHPACLLLGFDHLPDLHANALDSSPQSRKSAREGKP